MGWMCGGGGGELSHWVACGPLFPFPGAESVIDRHELPGISFDGVGDLDLVDHDVFQVFGQSLLQCIDLRGIIVVEVGHYSEKLGVVGGEIPFALL